MSAFFFFPPNLCSALDRFTFCCFPLELKTKAGHPQVKTVSVSTHPQAIQVTFCFSSVNLGLKKFQTEPMAWSCTIFRRNCFSSRLWILVPGSVWSLTKIPVSLKQMRQDKWSRLTSCSGFVLRHKSGSTVRLVPRSLLCSSFPIRI